jgi:succinyl-CoA synthetase beta subunit
MLASGVVPLQGLDDGLYAYARAADYFDFQRNRAASISLPRAAEPCGAVATDVLDEWQSKQQLSQFGLNIPDGKVVAASEAPTAARHLGFPVVVKAVGDAFLHKSDVGAVALDLANETDVAAAVSEIAKNAAAHDLTANEFLVERMVSGALAEFIIGVKRDEQFGPTLVIGSGGILVELMKDSVSLLLPCSRDEVVAAISTLAASRLLAGYRGAAKGDTVALVDAVLAIADYAGSCWQSLLELDVNPLMVLPEGKGVVAADALIIRASSSRTTD